MSTSPSSPNNVSIIWYIVATLLLIILIGASFVLSSLYTSQAQELVIGLLIILGVSVLTVLLFVVAAAFNSLHLSDPRQALGLPLGSVRALIALLLIIIWAIVSIFVFRFVAFGSGTPGVVASQDGIKLAQQLFTTMSTLVVAVSAFYFGSSSVAAAQQRALTSGAAVPVLLKVVPERGQQGQANMPLVIIGKNFLRAPKVVRFVMGSDDMVATGISITNTEVSLVDCTLTIKDDQKPGLWDLVVLNDDGNEYQLPKAFTIAPKIVQTP